MGVCSSNNRAKKKIKKSKKYEDNGDGQTSAPHSILKNRSPKNINSTGANSNVGQDSVVG